ncbi:MAG: bifunctional (p)ppGpp synthetase/guanosine-3',5'-bis(diphosphate) 3'-pyrophosphohydrolase [Chloroflexi bacterium]|nr:bifunctional (p)ppGpp synthetase/guanosine-3',5'-bis(diphosphate) 3'-pyrophosphohydrolase [Chloroflexota bacterium]
MTPEDVAIVRQAYEVAASAHSAQVRRSGDPYVTHPLATAMILAELHLDCATICAALLHDVVEDTPVPLGDVQTQFGEDVARLVDGVSKLKRFSLRVDHADFDSPTVIADQESLQRAENLRKMFLAMAEDTRVILIKLADRLHNLKTLMYHSPDKRRRIAQETLEIYAPLASRLGIWQMKWQLEDLAFRYLDPARYKEIANLLAARRVARERSIASAIGILHQEFERVGIQAEISGRPKHIYSIYRKMQRRGVDFNQIYDLMAIRVLVNEVSDCYSALGVIHSVWHPIPGQFDDYIAMPKESLYQSLHTTVVGPEGKPLEIQIRTHDMHRIAECGVAAHWRYKEGGRRDVKYEQKIAWLRQLLDWQKEVAGAKEFVESLKTDLFQDQVYVFTPKGEIRELPAGSTPLDFAYRIHTDVGHRCVGAKVNNRLVPLDYQLQNGVIVEILTSKTPKGPSRDWLLPNLNYVKSAHAREKIRQWFKRQQREENIARGREQLEKELSRLGLSQVKAEEIVTLFKFERVEDLYVAIGTGELSPQSISAKLVTSEEPPAEPAPQGAPAAATVSTKGVQVMGVGDLLSRLARCCNPVPGDRIVGYITRGKGITVHREDCPNIQAEDERERLVEVDWGRNREQVYPVNIRIEAWDRDGLLRDVATVVAEDHINMSAVSAVTHSDRTATIRATLEITGVDKLSRIFSRLEGLKGVMSIDRDHS